MKIKIAFYKHSKTLFGRVICALQRKKGFPERYARYSHVELVFENGESFSSSEQDGGVRFKNIDFKTENWDFIYVEVTKKSYDAMYKFCQKQVSNKYGKVGIFFAQILNINKKKQGTWFCSEIVTYALQYGVALWSTPSEFYTMNSLFTKPAELADALEWGEYIITE